MIVCGRRPTKNIHYFHSTTFSKHFALQETQEVHGSWPTARCCAFYNLFAVRVVNFGKQIRNSRGDSHCGLLSYDTIQSCRETLITQMNSLCLPSESEWGETTPRVHRQEKEGGYSEQWERRKLWI